MSESFKVYVVDDDPVILESMCAILGDDCLVEIFGDAESCLGRLEQESPDMFLLDVCLPGMNGYDLCRRVKDDGALAHIPVTFVSSHDTSEARLNGYDAGGEDFVVKPFDPAELWRKVRVAQQIMQNRRSLQEQIEAAEYLSSLALAGMDEGGIALQFMSQLIAYDNERQVAEGLLDLMKRYRLEGVVQTRIAGRQLTLSAAGTNLPLETSVLDHVKDMGRIFEFRNRGVHNFERVSLMINNLPLNDPDYCGRLRDNLSIAAQGADSRLRAIAIEEAGQRHHAGIQKAMESIRALIGDMRKVHEEDRISSSSLILALEESLADSFVHLGLTDNQERFLANLVDDFMRRLVAQLDRGEENYKALQKLGEQLEQLR